MCTCICRNNVVIFPVCRIWICIFNCSVFCLCRWFICCFTICPTCYCKRLSKFVTVFIFCCRIYYFYRYGICLICDCFCTAYRITVFRNSFYSIICFRCDCYCCCVNRIIYKLFCNSRWPNYRCCIFVCFYFCLRYFIFNRCS